MSRQDETTDEEEVSARFPFRPGWCRRLLGDPLVKAGLLLCREGPAQLPEEQRGAFAWQPGTGGQRRLPPRRALAGTPQRLSGAFPTGWSKPADEDDAMRVFRSAPTDWPRLLPLPPSLGRREEENHAQDSSISPLHTSPQNRLDTRDARKGKGCCQVLSKGRRTDCQTPNTSPLRASARGFCCPVLPVGRAAAARGSL